MKTARLCFVTVMLCAAFTMGAFAAGPVVPKPAMAGQVQAVGVTGDMVKKVDSYDYFIDYSGSMMMTHKQLKIEKMTAVKKILADVNALVPAFEYKAGLYVFAPYGAMIKNGPWNRAATTKAISDLEVSSNIFDRMTDLGDGFIEHAPTIQTEQGRKALILFTDGEVNRGPNPVIEARNLLMANPELCIHIVSLADTDQGQATLDAIARLKGCSVLAKAGDLLADPNAMRQFVKDVFYDERMEEVIVLRGVNFAFNSSQLDGNAQGILNEVANGIVSKPGSRVILNGYTDWIGTQTYNLGLSQRRADAVRAYLAARGVAPQRMQAVGRGISNTYDNNTDEGRYMNRRVEVVFEDAR